MISFTELTAEVNALNSLIICLSAIDCDAEEEILNHLPTALTVCADLSNDILGQLIDSDEYRNDIETYIKEKDGDNEQ